MSSPRWPIYSGLTVSQRAANQLRSPLQRHELPSEVASRLYQVSHFSLAPGAPYGNEKICICGECFRGHHLLGGLTGDNIWGQLPLAENIQTKDEFIEVRGQVLRASIVGNVALDYLILRGRGLRTRRPLLSSPRITGTPRRRRLDLFWLLWHFNSPKKGKRMIGLIRAEVIIHSGDWFLKQGL